MTGVFDFLNRVFDRQNMHKVENPVDINESRFSRRDGMPLDGKGPG
jgi:hypothetical protein